MGDAGPGGARAGVTGLLSRYLTRLFAARVLAAAVALLALLQILELLEVTTEVLERGLGVAGVVRYAALRLPTLLPQVLPLAVLVGAALTLAALAGRSEITAMRAGGVSLYRVVLILLPTAALVAILHLFAAEVAAPRAETALTSWWAATAPAAERDDDDPKWFRLDGDLVSVGGISPDGRRLDSVRLYERDEQGRLSARVSATTAEWTGDHWTLRAATATVLAADGVTQASPADRRWRTSLTPEVAVNLFSGEGRIAARAARQSLSGQGAANRSTAFYRTRLQRTFAEPLAAVVMLLLAVPVARAGQRGGRQALWVIAALAAGLSYLLLDGLLTSFGQTATLPPAMAAWTALVVTSCGAVWALLLIEG